MVLGDDYNIYQITWSGDLYQDEANISRGAEYGENDRVVFHTKFGSIPGFIHPKTGVALINTEQATNNMKHIVKHIRNCEIRPITDQEIHDIKVVLNDEGFQTQIRDSLSYTELNISRNRHDAKIGSHRLHHSSLTPDVLTTVLAIIGNTIE